MKNIFISQPMQGKNGEEILAEREKIFTQGVVKANVSGLLGGNEKVQLLDSYFPDFYDHKDVKNVGIKYLAKSIDVLASADILFMGSGWQDARGCKLENAIAVAYGIPVVEV